MTICAFTASRVRRASVLRGMPLQRSLAAATTRSLPKARQGEMICSCSFGAWSGRKPNMRDVSTLKPIGSAHCPEYNTEAKFYIDAAHKLGKRHLVVHYEKGGHNGAPEFVAGIPDDWSEENVI